MSATKLPGVEYDPGVGGDQYMGHASALIAAGLVTPDQLPGAPGMPVSGVTFVDGLRQPRTARPDHDERWMRICKVGRRFQVTRGISTDERERREDAREAEIQDMLRVKPDNGAKAAEAAVAERSARFKLGDRVYVDGNAAVVSGAYGMHRVTCSDGEYSNGSGGRFSYRLGYCAQYRNGEEFFYEAGCLTDRAGAPTHLRLVSGDVLTAAAGLPMRAQS